MRASHNAQVPSDLEDVACLICGSANSHPVFRVVDKLKIAEGDIFRIVACANCGFIFLNPRPTVEAIADFYPDAYLPFVSQHRDRTLWERVYEIGRVTNLRSKHRQIKRLKNTGAILDIGCGTGEFLNHMQQRGWQVAGVETDQRAADFAKQTYGLRVESDGFSPKNYLKNSFDVITLWHVLEHLHFPLETLQGVHKVLKDDGFLLLAMPNIASLDARFYGPNWDPLEAPRHLFHFTPTAVRALCDKAALQVVGMQQMPFDAFYNCLMSEFLITARGQKNRLAAGLRLGRALALAPLSTLSATRLRREAGRQGSSMLYIVRKKSEVK